MKRLIRRYFSAVRNQTGHPQWTAVQALQTVYSSLNIRHFMNAKKMKSGKELVDMNKTPREKKRG